MTALGKLFRTTGFQLALLYLFVFAVFAAFLLGYFAWNTRRLVTEQITQTVDAEILGLAEQYRLGGIRRLVLVVDARSRRPGSSLYLVTTRGGDALAGNVGSLDEGVFERSGWTETNYRRLDESQGQVQNALVRVFQLQDGFRLLVGRDLEERERMRRIVMAAGQWSVALVIILGLAGGFFIARRVLKRVEAMSATAGTIMAGDLSGRLPIAGTGDELDRLSLNLNAMLERIEALMHGLKEVSDNVAHDLKTPLTRLRNRCEAVLRQGGSEADYRAALQATIEESDALISTFNALLLIARAESGQAGARMLPFDARAVAQDVAELYEPFAEERGIALVAQSGPAVTITGSRELVSQALANLVDNAIKYAGGEGRPARVMLDVTEEGERVLLSVSDNGPGIADADRARVVERFVRLENSRTLPGSGLGLSLVSAVGHLHGGELRLEDNSPGLRAILVLPRAGPALASGTGLAS